MANNQQPGILPLPPPQPQVGHGGGGGGGRRGRRNRGGGGGRQAQPRQGNAQPVPPPPVGAPTPMHLATSSTPHKNDPLWTTGLAGADLQPLPRTEYIVPGSEVLPQVVSVLHATCTASSPGYARRVPESALAYYCAVQVYARQLYLARSNSQDILEDEDRFVDQVLSLQLQAPMLLAHYLSGFGNTKVPSGRNVRFKMLDRSNYITAGGVRGWFGRITAETQPAYQTLPCLAVFAARIMADLAEQEGAFERTWELPAEIQPRLQGYRGPSDALLGYKPRVRLTHTQRGFLEDVGLYSEDAFPSVNTRLPLAVDLLLAVQNELNNVSALKLSPFPTALVGSQAQLGIVCIEDESLGPAVRTAQFECGFELASEISFSASAFGYRIRHDVAGYAHTVAPWVVCRYDLVRADRWRDLVNAGNYSRTLEPPMIQISEFRTTSYLIKARLEALERAFARSGS